MKKITTLDYAILGLLLADSMTAYGLRMAFEKTALGNFSSSPGSIYPACNRLRKLGLIIKNEDERGLLEITDEGKSQMKSWLTKSITIEEVSKDSTIQILKFAFMDHLVTQIEKVTFLESFIQLTREYLRTLEDYHNSNKQQMPVHGRLSFEYGIATCRTQLNWAKSSLKYITYEN